MECVLETKTCIDINKNKMLLEKIAKGLKIDVPDKQYISAIMKHLNLKKESQLWANGDVVNQIGRKAAEDIYNTYYKPPGPWNTNELLSNIMIDNILSQWEMHSDALFKKKFKTMPCPCIDFKEYNHPMRDYDASELLSCHALGVVCNTDVHTGPGLHWICFYIDVLGKSIIFFNSSSRVPPPQLFDWLMEIQFNLKKYFNMDFKYQNIVKTPIQKSDTECGMWCIMFIRSQLLGYKPEWILTANDQDMLDFRSHVFLNTKSEYSSPH
jgi:Ulp1 protease family, C-terminal catalytic domain